MARDAYWIDDHSENIDADKTTFIIPFREAEHYSLVLDDVKKLGVELFSVFALAQERTVTDEGAGEGWSLESAEEKDGISFCRTRPSP